MNPPQTSPPPTPDGLPNVEKEPLLDREQLAANCREFLPSRYVLAASPLPANSDNGHAMDAYLEDLILQAGNPTDPIERMLLEQLAMAHHGLGRLYFRANENSKDVEAQKVYQAAIARLLGEFRRTALTLKKYREPPQSNNVTLVKQQNVAHNQQVAYVAGDHATDERRQQQQREKQPFQIEQGSSGAIEYAHQIDVLTQSTAGGGREAEPAVAAGADGGRPRAAAPIGPNQPAMAEVYRS